MVNPWRLGGVVRRFQNARAVSPEYGKTLMELGMDARRRGVRLAVNRLLRNDILIPAGAGRYYLDTMAWLNFRREHHRYTTTLTVMMLVLAFMTLVLGGMATRY